MDQSSMSGTPGGGGSNYRKVFKPNIPAPQSVNLENEHDSGDSVDRANALALGHTPTQNQRNKGGYEPSASQSNGYPQR